MSDGKEIAIGNAWSPEFIQGLLPPAERVALLYHLSYLCLGNFPKLERVLRERAVETQVLFSESEGVLLKCVGMSSNLATSLVPMLMKAVETNNPTLAAKCLEKARAGIDDIIRAVKDMVKRYHNLNQSVARCTSDVIQEKEETMKKITKLTEEVKSLTEALEKLEEELKETVQIIEEKERKIQEKNTQLQNCIAEASKRSHGLGILAAIVPFLGPIIKSIVDAATAPGEEAHIQSLNAEINRLADEKCLHKIKEAMIQVKKMNLQLQLFKQKIDLGVVPDPIHLNEVQKCLTRIQNILVELQNFWVKVGSMLDTLKEKTFVGKDLMLELKDDFINSIKIAGECWMIFGEGCQKVQHVFGVQSKEAYRFLDTDPSTLWKEEWESEYKSVMEKLNEISPNVPQTTTVTTYPPIIYCPGFRPISMP